MAFESSRALRAAPARVKAALYAGSLAGASALMDGVSRAVRALPARYRYLPADLVTLPVILLAARLRATIERNYATALAAPITDSRVRRLARASVRNYGRMAIDFLAVRTMTLDEVLGWVTPVNERYLREALEGGRGALLILPHFGSWDVAASFAQAFGLQLTIVTEGNWVAELVAGSRTSHGVTLVPRERSLRPLFRALARNECVVMLSDIAKYDLQAAAVPFLGHPARFPLGPARLSRQTSAPILVVSCARLPGGRYRIEPQPPLYADPGKPMQEAVADLTARVAAGFARVVAAHPAQWYPFHEIWDEQGS